MTTPEERLGETATCFDGTSGESPLQLENWTRGRVLTLFGVSPNTLQETKADLPQKGWARVNNATTYSGKGVEPLTIGSDGSAVRVALFRGLPVEGLLGAVPDVLGLPPPRPGVLLVVDKEVIFALHQRGIHRSDLLTPGRVRYDPTTKKRVGFEGLNRIDFEGLGGAA